MKLVHQINLAFAVSLILVLSVTGAVIHYVLLDHFIGTQREGLKTMGAAMSATLVQQATTASPPAVGMEAPHIAGTAAFALEASVFAIEASAINPAYIGVQAIVADSEGNIVREVLPPFVSAAEISPVMEMKGTEASGTVSLQKIWDGTDSRFITEVSPLPSGSLTLITPVSRIEAIERALLGRLLIIFAVGAGLMTLLSLLLTRKLIRPLVRLKEELQKVRGRHFSQVRLVKAGGEIGSVAKTVYEMAGELDRFNRVQKQFFQNASHELKTPLMSIAGYAEGIRDGVFEGDGLRQGLAIIIKECGRLKKLVMEMTLLAKLDSEEDIFQSAPVCVKELLTETVERMNPLLVSRGLTVQLSYGGDQSLLVQADRDKLLQALLNIASNAIRYARSSVGIRAELVEGRVEVSVSDDGKGIPEELLPYLFHRFVKGKDGESGLGLAISRAIVERCGGLIFAGNREEGGAEVRIGFPAAV
ncbi:MAG: histidine kinase [Paenibacillaceae bacterium]|jgi:signal transduction histidine kinase|nr:histidine kinase [Paenibacillaceae bacterium]